MAGALVAKYSIIGAALFSARAAAQDTPGAAQLFQAALELQGEGCTVPVPSRDIERPAASGCTQRNNLPGNSGGERWDMCGAKTVVDGDEEQCSALCAQDTELTGSIGGCTGFGYAAGRCHLYSDSSNCGDAGSLNWYTCDWSGHRRRSLQPWQHSRECDPTQLQARAADVEANCCANDVCDGALPTHCDYHCAIHLVPFYTDCGDMLASSGQDLGGLNDMCTPQDLTTLQTAINDAICPNAILSCHSTTGPVACVDSVQGGGASEAQLADCVNWDSQGGGWTPNAETCAGVQANLVVNGGFETPSLASVQCMGGHDSLFRGDDHCGYHYIFPLLSEFCSNDCSIFPWRVDVIDSAQAPSTTPAPHVVIVENSNAAWGGLDSYMDKQYLVLQRSGSCIEQTLEGLQRGTVYELRVRLANRPGYGDSETLIIKVDNHVIGESAHPADQFEEVGVAFTARSSSVVLRLENDTPGTDDSSVFIDEVVVRQVQLAEIVPTTNSNFDADIVSTYQYQIPSGWNGGGGIVVVPAGSVPWGGLTASGANYLGLQGLGSFVEQDLIGLVPGGTYLVTFSMADRPGFGEDEMLHVKIDGTVVWDGTHPEDGFVDYSAIFTATSDTASLRFENDSPEGDRTIFIDAVHVQATFNALSVVLPSSSAESQPYDFDVLTTPLSFLDAEAECERRNRKLASIHSEDENAFAASMHHGDDASIYQGLWIGAHDASDGSTSNWAWTDGSDFDWVNWGPEEPNNGRTTCEAGGSQPCGENCGIMSAHLSTWTDHANTGGGNDGTAGREDYQWNDGTCSGLQQSLCGPAAGVSGSRTLIGYYSFDSASAADESGNHRDGVIEGGVSFVDTGVSGKAAAFDGTGRITISSFRNWAWGNHFTVSVWFLRDPTALSNYMGIVNNGYYTSGSWEVRMGREMGGTSLGGGVITEGHDETWDVSGLPATVNMWHHVVLVYDSDSVIFYLDGQRTTSEADHGNILTHNTDVFIGQAGTGSSAEYFTGLIDEVRIYGRSLSHDEVLDVFHSTPHNGGHCENGADLTHCDQYSTADYCDAVSVQPITDIGAAMGTLDSPGVESSRIDAEGGSCDLDAALAPDGQPAGLARPAAQRTYAVWDGHAVTSCLEMDWGFELQANGIRFSAAASDEPMCGGDSCNGDTCGTGGTFLVYVSGAERASGSDYTTFYYQGTAQVPVDTSGSGNDVVGQMLFDELSFSQGDQAVQYVAICRSGAGGGRDNLLFDWITLRTSAADYMAESNHCDPLHPPPPPPADTTFVTDGLVFDVNSFDGVSWDSDRSQWVDVAGTTVAPAAELTGAHFVSSPLPAHFQFDGAEHFVFDHPEEFDFRSDFTVQILVRAPPNLEDFHMLISRRDNNDALSHHHIFVDTRSSWVGDWLVGEPVAVMYMGTGGSGVQGGVQGSEGGVWAYTNPFAAGDYVQLTFTVHAGEICGYVDGVRSGDCSPSPLLDQNRQMETGEPLEVGGEDSYWSHPLWSLSSLRYYNRALSEEEVAYNFQVSKCLEFESSCNAGADTCLNLPGWIDFNGYGCEPFNNPSHAATYCGADITNGDGVTAADACCKCGGGHSNGN